MKLDRNTNSDGRGKYALLNLRTNQIQWGDKPDEEFFVIKLKDRFATAALDAYADSVRDEIRRLRQEGSNQNKAEAMRGLYNKEAEKLEEYEGEIRHLAETAAEHPSKHTPD